jgi:hypothetical protein
MTKPLCCPLLLSLLLLFFHVAPVRGVVVTGTVKKTANEPVAGAEVTFTNEDDAFEVHSDIADDDGGYRIDLATATAIEENHPTPSSFQLHQNYPNPFNSTTVITYNLPAPGHTRLEVYNSLGQRVQTLIDAWQEAGFHTITWDGLDDSGRGNAAGVYIYKLTAGSFGESRKMVLSDGASGRSSAGAAAGKAVVQQDLPTYRVHISGSGMEPFEQHGLVFEEDSVTDFTVQRETVESIWQMGTPIVGYYHGPGGGGGRWGPFTPGMAEKLVDGGFTLAWGTTVEDLDVAHAHGLRMDLLIWDMREPSNLDDPAAKARIDEIVDAVKDHPALYSYAITDEPSAKRFPEFARMVAYIRERDPAHLAHINLFPTYAGAGALGTSGGSVEAYQEHLRQYVDIVKPDLISYDHYGLYTNDDGNQYFMNLHLVREAALYGGIPFINVIQAVSLGPSHRIPNGDESRFLGFTTLAYGGQGIMHFVYWPYSEFHGGISGFEDIEWTPERAEADAAAALTPLGEALREIHPEFVAVAEQLQPLTSLAVYHSGRGVPGWHIDRLQDNDAFVVDPPFNEEQDKGVIFGYFGSVQGEVSHALIVNLDHGQGITTTVVGSGAMEEFDPQSRQWQSVSDGSRAEVNLVAGGGKLLRLKEAP